MCKVLVEQNEISKDGTVVVVLVLIKLSCHIIMTYARLQFRAAAVDIQGRGAIFNGATLFKIR